MNKTKKTIKKAMPMARINTRIRPSQQKFIKAQAKKQNVTEGEIFRDIIDMAMESKKVTRK